MCQELAGAGAVTEKDRRIRQLERTLGRKSWNLSHRCRTEDALEAVEQAVRPA